MNPESILTLLSLGLSVSVAERNDAGNLTTRLHQAEFVTQGYVKLDHPLWFLRPGVRLGYEYVPYPDDPQSVRIDESTWNGALELGLLYEGVLIPSLTWQSALLARRLNLVTRGNLLSGSSGLPTTEWLSSQAVALGLGVPLAAGRLILEPFCRFVWLKGDERRAGQWGLDATWAISWGETTHQNSSNYGLLNAK